MDRNTSMGNLGRDSHEMNCHSLKREGGEKSMCGDHCGFSDLQDPCIQNTSYLERLFSDDMGKYDTGFKASMEITAHVNLHMRGNTTKKVKSAMSYKRQRLCFQAEYPSEFMGRNKFSNNKEYSDCMYAVKHESYFVDSSCQMPSGYPSSGQPVCQTEVGLSDELARDYTSYHHDSSYHFGYSSCQFGQSNFPG